MPATSRSEEGHLPPPRPVRRYVAMGDSFTAGVEDSAPGERWPDVLVGSYPSFLATGSEVEVVLKSTDPQALATASAWIEVALDEATR